MVYTTTVKLKNKTKKKNLGNNKLTNYIAFNQKFSYKKKFIKRIKKQNRLKALFAFSWIFVFVILVSTIFGLSYLKNISNDLPSPDQPFGKKNMASELYDRNGNLLYRVFGSNDNRDPVELEQVPDLLIWSFLAAEDIDFYSHPGLDISGILRCTLRAIQDQNASCGGSTITQQLVKQTALSDERKLERKIKEIILSLQIERLRSKEEILEMYLTVVPEGSNVYSVTRGAKFYFGKELSELNLAEMAVLASIPQNPSRLSPTKSPNPDRALVLLESRKQYVLNQMEIHMDKINAHISTKSGNTEPVLTQQMIDEARTYELAYRQPFDDIKAPHFVFYAQKLLQQRNYNNGIPFTLAELETGGYRIWTTVDLEFQAIGEEQVQKGVATYGSRFGSENGSLITMNPKTGEILAMVGSKDYFGQPSPPGCRIGYNCRFEPQVNVTDSYKSFGSSMKPMVFYLAMMKGIVAPGSLMADVPIQIGSYTPKNYEGGFTGLQSARWMLVESRNIPAIYLVDQMGVDTFVDEMRKWGYSLKNPYGFGPSIAVGGGDITLIEHAEGYSVLANEGKHTPHEVIIKIEDSNGNIIYEHKPESQQVADPRGVFLVNDMLNGRKRGPGVSWDGRDISGKTGTSEGQRDTLFATYTPEIVVIGRLGNNDNTRMRYGASGSTSVRPWVGEYVKRIGSKIPPTPFRMPEGVYYSGGDLMISGIGVSASVSFQKFLVCVDQTDRLARPIDISMGKAMEISVRYYKMPDPRYQKFLDSWLSSQAIIPTEYCTIDRTYIPPTPIPPTSTPIPLPTSIPAPSPTTIIILPTSTPVVPTSTPIP
jgi:penicillin-binding protein 1A